MKRLVFILILLPFLSFSQTITEAEYYLDTDPGFGNGTPIPVPAPSQLVNLNFTLSTSTLNEGTHNLFIRVKDDDGIWSLYESRLIYINSISATPDLTYLEYFFNSDPGFGNGTAINIPSPGQAVNIATTISTSGLNTGFNTLFMRAKDSDDQWSLYEVRLIYVNDTLQKNIIAAEYFIDTVGAPGTGMPLTVTNPGSLVTFTDDFITSNLALGNYSIYVRVQDNQGVWSHYEKINISICTTFGPLSYFDYYVNGNTVYFTNNSENADATTWIFGDGNSDNLKINPSHNYANAGIYNVKLVSSNICGTDTVTKSVEISGLASVSPKYSGHTGFISMNLKGYGFASNATVSLVKSGQSDLIPDTVIFIDPYSLKANFFFDNAQLGFWNVVVTVPGNFSDTLFNAFEIQPVQQFDPWFDIVGPNRFRPNFSTSYKIAIGNNGNTTVFGVPVTIFLHPEWNSFLLSELITDTISIDTFPKFNVVVDSITGDSLLMGSFVIGHIQPGEVEYLNFLTNSQTQGNFEITAHIGPPMIPDSIISYAMDLKMMPEALFSSCGFLPPCLQCLLDLGGLAPGPLGCLANVFNLGCAIGNNLNNPSGSNALDLVGTAAGAFFSCTIIINASALLATAADAAGAAGGLNSALGSCAKCVPKPKKPKPVNVVIPIDPNIKEGPTGYTTQHYINGDGYLHYSVYFENIDTATAPAVLVTINDMLDTSKFDLSTFQFVEYGFGDTSFAISESGYNYVHDIGLTNLILRVKADLNVETGELQWKFISFEPDTMTLTSDPAKGFLPPNVTAPEGEGFVRFMVKLKPGYQHLDVIQNEAEIIFDFNSPINTPVWSNTIDLAKPQSNVLPLSSNQSDTVFTVYWTGSDAQSGVMEYNIYVSENSGPYQLWKYGMTVDSALFIGINGNSYAFYSVATDYVLNVEDTPATADAVTAIVTSVEEKTATGWMNLFPNPASSEVLCSYFISEKANAEIELTDLLGRTILDIDLKKKEAGEHQLRIDVSNVSTGYYILNLKLNGKNYLREKLLINN